MAIRRPGKNRRRSTLPKRATSESALPAQPQEPSVEGQLAKLTSREREVLALWLEAHFNAKRVAARLGTQPHTVRNQLASIEHKLGLRSRTELAAMTITLLPR